MTPTRRTFIRFLASAAAATGLSRFAGRVGAEPFDTPAPKVARPETPDERDSRHVYLTRTTSKIPLEARQLLMRLVDLNGADCLCVDFASSRADGGDWRSMLTLEKGGDWRIRCIQPNVAYCVQEFRIYQDSGTSVDDLVRSGWRVATAKEAKKFLAEA